MKSSPPDNGQSSVSKDILGLRKDLIRLLALALPAGLVNLIVGWILDRFTSQPWQGLYFLAPLSVAAWILWHVIKGRKQFVLRGIFLVFFICYVLVFSLAAGSSLLEWKRTPLVGYEEVPPNFLALNWLGDWRYFLARRNPRPHNLTVVTLEPAPKDEDGRPRVNERRGDLLDLIRTSMRNEAKAIIFDMHFQQESDGIDNAVCAAIAQAKAANIPVLIGYTFERSNGSLRRMPTARTLRGCVPSEDHGHLLGVREWDQKVRYVPLYFAGNRDLPALSLRTARLIAGSETNIHVPRGGLLQFVAPESPLVTVRYRDLMGNTEKAAKLRDQFVFVGEESPAETFRTPFGELPGVVIHAYATHSILQNHFVRRTLRWSSFPAILVFCYLLATLLAQGTETRKLLGLLAVISAGAFAAAALAMYAWLVWVDLIYFLTALWLLFLLLVGLRKHVPIGNSS